MGNDTTFSDLVIDGGCLALSPRTIGDIKLGKLALIISQVRSADFTPTEPIIFGKFSNITTKDHLFADFLLNFSKLQISSNHPNFFSISMKMPLNLI